MDGAAHADLADPGELNPLSAEDHPALPRLHSLAASALRSDSDEAPGVAPGLPRADGYLE